MTRSPTQTNWFQWAGTPTVWPFAPGESPFRVKGSSYRGHRVFMDAEVPGGSAAIFAKLDPVVREFYNQPFLASSWYDLAPLVAMASLGGAGLGLTPEAYLVKRSRFQADQDMRGVYAFLIKLVSGKTIAVRLPKLIALYFDFVETETKTVDERRVVTAHHGLPAPLAPWLLTVASAYLGRVLEIAKPGRHQIETSPLVGTGEAHGIALLSFELSVQLG